MCPFGLGGYRIDFVARCGTWWHTPTFKNTSWNGHFFHFLHLSWEVLTFLLPRPPGDSRVPWVPLGASWVPPGCLLGASLVSPGCLLGVSWVLPCSPYVSQMPPRRLSDASQSFQFNSIQIKSSQTESDQFNFNQIGWNQTNSIRTNLIQILYFN